jgi:hypothetical protein
LGISRSVMLACCSIINSRVSPNTEGLKGASYGTNKKVLLDRTGGRERSSMINVTFALSISAKVKTFPLAPRVHILCSLEETC